MSVDLNGVQDEFPIAREMNFQNNAGVAPLSRRAVQAMRDYLDHALHHSYVASRWYQQIQQVRVAAASLINASTPKELTFVKNTTEGLCWVANGLGWLSGDNVVTSAVEFPANIYPWMHLGRRGVELRMVPEQDGVVRVEDVIAAIDDRTRLVTISAVQYASGCRMDLASIGRACRMRGVFFCVDAIQALGVLPIDVQAMQIDFLSADGHKWLCGPEGAGIFYCRRDMLDVLEPSDVGWMGMVDAQNYGDYRYELLGDVRRFDVGTYNVPGILGLGGSIDLLTEIGIDTIAAHVLGLTDHLVAGLIEKGYQVVSPRDDGRASGIVSFVSPRHDLNRLCGDLETQHGIVIACREGRLRASPHLYATREHIDDLLAHLPPG